MNGIRFDPETHTYTRVCGTVVPSVTQVLQPMENYLQTVPESRLLFGRDRGTAVHQAVHLDILGELDEDSLDPVVVPFFEAWRKWRREHPCSVLMSEHIVHDHIEGYAGTLDLVVQPEWADTMNWPWLLDIKSGEVSPVSALQTAGYASALMLTREVKVCRRGVLQLKPSGEYQLHPHTQSSDYAAFKAALTVYKWRKLNNV